MSQKYPAWTRTRVGRNRVHWLAYDDRADSQDRQIVDQGYAASLAEADVAARAALAAAGMYQARRMSSTLSLLRRGDVTPSSSPVRPSVSRPREYLYTRRHDELDDAPLIAAHLILKKTARKVYVTRRSCGPDQLGTDDESWETDERPIALDRERLEQDGSVYSGSLRESNFYASRQGAMGDSTPGGHAAWGVLEIQAPCTLEAIKTAYRRRALEVHPDRGGSSIDFQAVEAAYRRLLREAQAPEV